MKYIAWITQNGEGCDYIIGCGCNLYELKAEIREEAVVEIREMVAETTCREWAERYKTVTVYEISDAFEANAEGIYRQEEERLATLAVQEIERKERATYERLKAKYKEEM